MHIGLHIKYMLSSILMKLESFDNFSRSNQISNSNKFRPVGAE
jgi:hypothetical protein